MMKNRHTLSTIIFVAIISCNSFAKGVDAPTLANCNSRELTAYYFLKSLEPSYNLYDQSRIASEEAEIFIKSKKLNERSSIKSQLSVNDNLKLNTMLEKIKAYDIRGNIEKRYYRDRSVLIAMIALLQDDDLAIKEILNKDLKVTALFVSIANDWNSLGKNYQKPFYEYSESTSCNIYTLALQLQDESYNRINSGPEEIKILSRDAGSIMEKVQKNSNGINSLSPIERSKYNRIKDVFPKLEKFRNYFDYMEQIKGLAYISDLRHDNAVDVWEKNLGDVASIEKSLDNVFSSNVSRSDYLRKINSYFNLFEINFPYLEFFDNARSSPAEPFKKK